MIHFTPWSALAGGILIGLSAVLLLWLNGRIAGISGITGGLWFNAVPERIWRMLFIAGLILGAGAWVALSGNAPVPRAQFPAGLLVLAGLLVGFGTSMSHGCTSGHGVCGMAQLSPRSITATATFLLVGIGSCFVVRHLLHIA